MGEGCGLHGEVYSGMGRQGTVSGNLLLDRPLKGMGDYRSEQFPDVATKWPQTVVGSVHSTSFGGPLRVEGQTPRGDWQ